VTDDVMLESARSRDVLERLVEEQAALRRIATLVAQDATPAKIFAAVGEEVDRLFRLDPGTADVVVVARFDPGPKLVVVGMSRDAVAVPLGSSWEPDEPYAPTHVLRTGRSARIGERDLASVGGPAAAFLREHGHLYQVASPIVVLGRLWGAISINSRHALPPDTEERLEAFTGLVAAALANAASRDALARVAGEQATLRRITTLMAEGVPPEQIFAAVADEAAATFGAITAVMRFDHDPPGMAIVGVSKGSGIPVGTRWEFTDEMTSAEVYRTGRPARRGAANWPAYTGRAAEVVHRLGVASQVACPIVVGGSPWGVLTVTAREELPRDTEQRLQTFTELITTVIASTHSRSEVERLAEQQAALRRVATLVAVGAAPTDVFTAVTWEVARLFDFAAVTLNRYDGDAVVVLTDPLNSGFPVGSRWPFDGDSLAVRVQATGRMARIDDYSGVDGTMAARMRERASRSAIGVPIVVEGGLWGILCVGAAASELLPADTETRIAGFVELVGTAIANSQARDGLRLLADEQAALRRVATLVARDAPSTEVFDAVATEVGALLETDICVVGRIDGDGAATAIGSWSAAPGGVPVGTRSAIGGRNVLTLVAETGEPARIDGYDDTSGAAADIARSHDWRSSIAAPIAVEGRVWGVMLVATQRAEPFPAGAERRLAAFTDLIATAIGNAQAHDEVRRFADEQVALGRVATLVAAGAAPERVFATVVEEVSSLLGLDRIELVRYDGDTTGTVAAASGDHPFPAGTRWSLDDPSVMATVARTKRAARIDDYSTLTGEIARVARSAGFRSAIGAPITVQGSLWGAIIAISTGPEPVPEQAESRLGQFTELVATAVANAESRAELAASRRRIVAASDETRRQIERNLHDGTQQRLVSLGLAIRAAEATLAPEQRDVRSRLSDVVDGLAAAVEDLQEISRGIHPAILSKGGLGPALRTLAHRSAIPVNLEIAADTRLAEAIEVAAYFVASEALANAAKHSQASRIDMALAERDGRLLLSVRDDGMGGADPARGSGLVGLTDRVEALGGSIRVDSRSGEGTQIAAELPVELPLPQSTG
jgi:signal transduction histidine kinase